MSLDRWTRPHPHDYPARNWSDHQSILGQIDVHGENNHRSETTITTRGRRPGPVRRETGGRGFYWEVRNP
jgi:hypothetical protein